MSVPGPGRHDCRRTLSCWIGRDWLVFCPFPPPRTSSSQKIFTPTDCAGRPAQSEERPPNHPGHFPHRRRRTSGSRRQAGRAEADVRGAAARALCRPRLLTLPFTSGQKDPVRLFVSLLLRPLVCPAVGQHPRKAWRSGSSRPASLVSNLDFVESIFGNGGDPYLPENDAGAGCAALDRAHRLRHSGAAPGRARRRRLGCRHYDQATERQRATACAGQHEEELYNNGRAFKVACRDRRGVMVTIIADNYFGYCKKEVKTQISFAANLLRHCARRNMPAARSPSRLMCWDRNSRRTHGALEEGRRSASDAAARRPGGRQPEGYAVDRRIPQHLLCAGERGLQRREGFVRWSSDGERSGSRCAPATSTSCPRAIKFVCRSRLAGTAWRLVGSRADGTLCHKPCTVSGGGKSEISKSIASVLLKGPVFVKDYHARHGPGGGDPGREIIRDIYTKPAAGRARARVPF